MTRVLWKDERERFLAALGKESRHAVRNKALMLVAYDTGARVSEIAALDLSDYDHQRKSLHVINCKVEGHPKREIPLHSRTSRALQAYIKKRPKTDNPALFLSQKGNRISDRQIRDVYRDVCKRAGISGKGIHTLRHTMATRLLDEKVLDIHQISRRLGHRNIATTYKYYVHASIEEESNAINKSRM